MKIRIKLLFLVLIIFGCQMKEKKAGPNGAVPVTERHRPVYHFTPPAHWMNDPNGMVYYDNEYHLFYQYYPDSTVWGPMHWGHAISKDLVHWEHLPVALYPDSLGYIFSGSAVIDWNNSSGLGKEGKVPLVAIFTYHNAAAEKAGSVTYQNQGIAFSVDKGRTWKKYSGNPVLKNPGIKDFRDPKVSWNTEENKWIMTLAVSDHISFYSSPDLIHWRHESDFGKDRGAHGGVWECPDLFSLPVDATGEEKWVLLVSINPGAPNGGSGTQYFVGDFDGKTFTDDNDSVLWIDHGRDNYAGVTWSDIPENDGRRIFLGWMSNWDYAQVVPTDKWRSAMTFPRTLSLKQTSEGLRLYSYPVREVKHLQHDPVQLSADKMKLSELDLDSGAFDLQFTAADIDQGFEIRLFSEEHDTLKVRYDTGGKQFTINRKGVGNPSFSDTFGKLQVAHWPSEEPVKNIRLLVDVASVELFVNEGRLAMTSTFFPSKVMNHIQITDASGKPVPVNGTVYGLK